MELSELTAVSPSLGDTHQRLRNCERSLASLADSLPITGRSPLAGLAGRAGADRGGSKLSDGASILGALETCFSGLEAQSVKEIERQPIMT